MRDRIDFTPDYGSKENSSIIKVIGVGGGGGNAVKHMYSEGIVGVDFLICNTDAQALAKNVVPSQLVLGDTGLGAGARPEVGRELAEKSINKIKEFIGEETMMLFITAGMGKGTGTGSAPVVAKVAHEMGILTIGVVTYPFDFEGSKRQKYAAEGIEEMEKYVDSLIVVKNENLLKYYGDESVEAGFSHADDVLKNAVKCIAELITVNADQNIDFNDIKTIMKDSGHSMLGLAEASGENRVETVVENALSCPLLSEDVIIKAQNFLFFISYGPDNELKISELKALTERFNKLKTSDSDVIWGRAKDETLGDKIRLSVIITNYEHKKEEPKKTITIDDNSNVPSDPWGLGGDFFGQSQMQQQQANVQPGISDNDFDFSKIEMSTKNTIAQELHLDPKPETQHPIYANGETELEPVMATVESEQTNSSVQARQHVPQRIGVSDSRYDDDEMFRRIVDTPAIFREKRQEDFENQMSRQNPFGGIENDISSLFSDIPD